jgi:hypothetical protein
MSSLAYLDKDLLSLGFHIVILFLEITDLSLKKKWYAVYAMYFIIKYECGEDM